jgi:hypothetical protein
MTERPQDEVELWEDNEADLAVFGEPDSWDGEDLGDSGTDAVPVPEEAKPGDDVT